MQQIVVGGDDLADEREQDQIARRRPDPDERRRGRDQGNWKIASPPWNRSRRRPRPHRVESPETMINSGSGEELEGLALALSHAGRSTTPRDRRDRPVWRRWPRSRSRPAPVDCRVRHGRTRNRPDTMAMSCQEKRVMPTTDLTLQPHTPDRWERALYAFLAEKERPSGSAGLHLLRHTAPSLRREAAASTP